LQALDGVDEVDQRAAPLQPLAQEGPLGPMRGDDGDAARWDGPGGGEDVVDDGGLDLIEVLGALLVVDDEIEPMAGGPDRCPGIDGLVLVVFAAVLRPWAGVSPVYVGVMGAAVFGTQASAVYLKAYDRAPTAFSTVQGVVLFAVCAGLPLAADRFLPFLWALFFLYAVLDTRAAPGSAVIIGLVVGR